MEAPGRRRSVTDGGAAAVGYSPTRGYRAFRQLYGPEKPGSFRE